MEQYFLLRDNRESGPYTVKELKAKGLYPDDLLWLDGESTCWKNPADFAALNELVKERERKPAIVRQLHSVAAQNADGAERNNARETAQAVTISTTDTKLFSQVESSYDPSFEETKFSFSQNAPRKKAWQLGLNIGANLVGLATLVIGVMLTAVMVKKAVDNIASDSDEPVSDAKAIVTENLREDPSKHAALSNVMPVQTSAASNINLAKPALQHDSTTKIHAAINLVKKEAPTKKVVPLTNEETKPDNTANEAAAIAAAQQTEAAEKKKAADAIAEKASAKASLQVSANDYKVGLFGGISHLALTINNPSSQPLENIVVEVEYLKPNGKIVATKTVDAGSLASGASKTVAVPDNGRGVEVRYHVADR